MMAIDPFLFESAPNVPIIFNSPATQDKGADLNSNDDDDDDSAYTLQHAVQDTGEGDDDLTDDENNEEADDENVDNEDNDEENDEDNGDEEENNEVDDEQNDDVKDTPEVAAIIADQSDQAHYESVDEDEHSYNEQNFIPETTMEEADGYDVDFEENNDTDFEEDPGATAEFDYNFDDEYDDNPEATSKEVQNEEHPPEMDETPESLGAYGNEQHG